MRLRIERRIRKRLRKKDHTALARLIRQAEKRGLSLTAALREAAAGASLGREQAASLLGGEGLEILLRLFQAEEDQGRIFDLARNIYSLGNRRAFSPLIGALQDSNPHRRHAAAYALGWMPRPNARAIRALIAALGDSTQPENVRSQAAESLCYHLSSKAIPALIMELSNPATSIRFFAVYALGGIAQRRRPHRAEVIRALEPLLNDNSMLPGWWSVSQEALAMLGPLDAGYAQQLAGELDRVETDPNASKENRDWFGFYGP